jgi:uncharacterized protein YceK
MRAILLTIAFAVLAGCGSIASQKKNDTLEVTLLAYSNALLWGTFEDAVKFLDPEAQKEHPLTALDLERYKQVRVTSYNEKPVVPISKQEVRQVVEIGVLNINTQSERTIIDNQVWRYDDKTKHWHVMALPDITKH